MQKLVAKYGLAAHLALLAVAPLVLFPYLDGKAMATVMLWLSAFAGVWLLLEPSVRSGEHLRRARMRVLHGIARDPLFWASVAVVAFAGLRALNAGVGLGYDAELSVWKMQPPDFPILPGSVGDAGFLPFAVSVAGMVLMQGCRHSMGRASRMAFWLLSSALTGLGAAVAIVAAHFGCEGAGAMMAVSDSAFTFLGLACGFHLLSGTVALETAFENRWNAAMLLLPLSVGGTGAGLFCFSPTFVTLAFAGAELVVLAYSFFYACRRLPSAGEFKLLVVCGVSFALGGLLVMMLTPAPLMQERLAAFAERTFFAERFWKLREVLSAIAFKSWVSHLWTGTGLASFSLDFRFNARPEDWMLLPRGIASLPSGWWLILAERGVVGAVMFVLPFGFLLFTYGRRLALWISDMSVPHPACVVAPVALALFVASGFVDCSLTRADVILVMVSLLAVSAAAFPRRKKC